MSDGAVPPVSVVIPCRNEVKAIRQTVLAILNSSYPNLEVLVVDGMSEDGTREILMQLARENPRVRMIDNPKKLTPFAFNLGIKNAQGEFIQIVGSRNVLADDYLAILVDALQSHPEVDCVGGDYQHVSDTPAGRHIALAMESKFGVGMGNYRTMQEDALVDTVGVPMYRSTIFDEIGLFDEALTRNQDDDFNFRLSQRGKKIMYVHAAKTTYLVRASLAKAFRQFFQYGYFKVFVNRKHKRVTTVRQLIPPAFVAALVVGAPLSFFFPPVQRMMNLMMAAYFVLGLVLAGKGLSLGDRLQVLFCCLVMHLGYGLGYLQGIWDFLVIHRPPRAEMQRQTT
jgi:glycosyltransferase involved in cell wall biosynthesis